MSTHPRPGRRPLATLASIALAAACATYPERTAEALHDFQGGHLERALELYEDPDYTDSTFLSGAEAGTVALTMGDWERARVNFHVADEASQDVLGRGALEPTRLAENLASFGLNDTTKGYGGEGFERVYVHACLAMSYLALGLLDDVSVEARRANELLENEEKLYEKEYKAGGFGHLMSAVAYELRGELDQAYIDYERMEAKGVGTEIAGKALVRIARQLGREDELVRWTERYGADEAPAEDSASIVVLAGVGLGPFKDEIRIVLPLPEGFFSMAVPDYRVRPQPVSGLSLTLPGSGQGVRTALVEQVSAVAEENLSDRIALITAKSVGRGILKRELTKQLEDQFDIGGRIAGDLFSIVSERADLRAWQTLPDAWHAARIFVPPGTHALELAALGGESRALGSYELEPGETMVVLARTVETRLYAHPIGGRPLEAASAAEESHQGAATVP